MASVSYSCCCQYAGDHFTCLRNLYQFLNGRCILQHYSIQLSDSDLSVVSVLLHTGKPRYIQCFEQIYHQHLATIDLCISVDKDWYPCSILDKNFHNPLVNKSENGNTSNSLSSINILEWNSHLVLERKQFAQYPLFAHRMHKAVH